MWGPKKGGDVGTNQEGRVEGEGGGKVEPTHA